MEGRLDVSMGGWIDGSMGGRAGAGSILARQLARHEVEWALRKGKRPHEEAIGLTLGLSLRWGVATVAPGTQSARPRALACADGWPHGPAWRSERLGTPSCVRRAAQSPVAPPEEAALPSCGAAKRPLSTGGVAPRIGSVCGQEQRHV